jgi:MFS family permease
MPKKIWSREFTAIVSSNLLLAWAFYSIVPTLPIYLTRDLKISYVNTGLITAAFPITAIAVRPLAGYLVDNYQRFMVFILSLSLITALYGIYPLVAGVAALFLLRLTHGAAWGICTSASSPLIADIVPAARLGEAIGIFALSMPIGMTVGPTFGLGMLQGHGPVMMFLSIFAMCLLSLLIALFAKTPFKKVTKKRFSFANVLHPKALPLSLCMFLAMIAYGAVITFAGIYAAQKGFPNVGTFFLCFASALFLSRILLRRLFDRGYFIQLILAGVILAAIGLVWLGCAWSPTQFLLAPLLIGAGYGILMPTCHAAINNLADPHERGTANSNYLASYDMGLGVGSLLIGALADKMSLGAIYSYSSLLVVLSGCIFVLVAIPHYQRNKPTNADVLAA